MDIVYVWNTPKWKEGVFNAKSVSQCSLMTCVFPVVYSNLHVSQLCWYVEILGLCKFIIYISKELAFIWVLWLALFILLIVIWIYLVEIYSQYMQEVQFLDPYLILNQVWSVNLKPFFFRYKPTQCTLEGCLNINMHLLISLTVLKENHQAKPRCCLFSSTFIFDRQLPKLSCSGALLAAREWITAEAPVMKVRGVVEVLQVPTHWNLTTQPVITDIEELQLNFSQLLRNTPCEFVVIQI